MVDWEFADKALERMCYVLTAVHAAIGIATFLKGLKTRKRQKHDRRNRKR